MAAIDRVLSILANSKSILQLPTATVAPAATDWFVFWNVTTQRAEKIESTKVSGFPGWVWIDSYWVQKGSGNTDLTVLETGDEVYFRKITNGTDPITLMGQSWDGGDEQLRSNYTQNQVIDV